MNFLRLLERDFFWYRKPLICLSLAACLVSAVLTSALLIGDSVRGTLSDNLAKGTSCVKTLLRFSTPIQTDMPNGALHVSGFISAELKADIYAFPNTSSIQGRDAYCSMSLSKQLKLKIGDTFTIRVLTMPEIASEQLMGMPPQLKQLRLVYKGVWQDKRVDVNFDNPQVLPNNLFINHGLLTKILDLETSVVNEIWLDDEKEETATSLSDTVIWKLSQLEIEEWNRQPILKSKAYFLPQNVVMACPNAHKGLITFAQSLTDTTGTQIDYFFVGAFEGDLFPVSANKVVLSDDVTKQFTKPVSLTCYVSDNYRNIVSAVHAFTDVTIANDSLITSELCPDIPGLTDASDCSQWISGIPIDLKKVRSEDESYWDTHKSKPKAYLNFAQAQKIFAPDQSTLLLFEHGTSHDAIMKQIIPVLRHDSSLYQRLPVAEMLERNIHQGVQFAPLFLGLSLFIIMSGLLILWMLLKLHVFDRSLERQLYCEYVASTTKVYWFITIELMLAILPGIILGLLLGVLFCLIQLVLLENVWNGIVGMERLNFYASLQSFLIAFISTVLSSGLMLLLLLRKLVSKPRLYCSTSHRIQSLCALGTLSFIRRFVHYRLCIVLLVLGFVGTLGVGSLGIKVRGENGFSYAYVAQTAVPVVPSFDSPLPPGGLPVRVYQAERADCSSLLRASEPTVFGCDLSALTSQKDYLTDFCAAADTGSMQWIMKKKLGDMIDYPGGKLKLTRAMRASVFQSGILVNDSTFQSLFPNLDGAQFFLIRDQESAEAYKTYLEPYGVSITSVDNFMAHAEQIQNRYLAIFLQLGILGFILGIGSLVLMILRNLYSQQQEIRFMLEAGMTRASLFRLYYVENGWIYGLAALLSLVLLGMLALVSNIHLPVLFAGWVLLTVIGTVLVGMTLKIFFSNSYI